jgi:hypothetical protein
MKCHFISPYRTDRNIGLAINQAINDIHTNDEDWICLTDMDVLWLRPDSKSQLIEILSSTDYHLLGATTNRLANDYQLCLTWNGESAFNNTDIKFHLEISNYLHAQNYGNVIPFQHVLAAFCLCFRVETWKLLGGFEEGTITFDTTFSLHAQQHALKLGLMTGIYLFHGYRIDSDNPRYDVKHLIA